ncbi:hypothetical protein BK004_02660 [bacterium CG10_46_32]|nr:MAG: hypothetical protein BK004_02660 [bacterium CG10_46_32]PIR56103.1 MAG: hypothetical protein COU73_02685 [Parcubacteria group bacterium CG10_big_fil_rev_8_21_14_0_10_46_32]
MEETSNTTNRGFLLIASLLVLSSMMIMVSFYLSAVMQDVRTSRIIDTAPQAYYLAESGIQEAYWKLENDSAYKTNFETNPTWSTTFTRNDSIIPGSSYTVTIQNSGVANAVITATSTINVQDTQSQRVVQASVFKAINNSPYADIAVFSNEEIYAAGGSMSVTGGDIFTNEDIDLNFFSSWETSHDARAVNSIDISITSSFDAANMYDQNNAPTPTALDMPQIDFDSSDQNSFKSRADQIYTTGQFNQLLNDYPILTLNGITYVTGNAFIKKGDNLTINGTLVADGSITIGNGYSSSSNPATLTINKVPGEPSGLISKKNITIGGYSVTLSLEGLIYAAGELRIQDGFLQNLNLDVIGGIIAQNIQLLVSWTPFTVTYDEANINDALGTPVTSQPLIINHWEEQY